MDELHQRRYQGRRAISKSLFRGYSINASWFLVDPRVAGLSVPDPVLLVRKRGWAIISARQIARGNSHPAIICVDAEMALKRPRKTLLGAAVSERPPARSRNSPFRQ